jgi:predicted AlkP superfamily pyrophosphatase or phosphodiesterase
VPSETDFVVVSDHGFLPVSQSLQPNAVLTSIGLSAPIDAPEKWRVAAFSNGSSFGLVVHDPKDAEAIALATKTFKQMASDGTWGIDKVLDGDALIATKGYSNSFLAVGLKSGYMLGNKRDGMWLTSSGETHGMHGFQPGDPLLEASFVAFGPGISHRKLGAHRLVDVASTVAALLNLPDVQTEGKNLLSK